MTNKTQPTQASVTEYINAISDTQKKQDAIKINSIMYDITKEEAVMRGTSIVGYGSYYYRYESGHEWNICLIGWASRTTGISIYGAPYHDEIEILKTQLGKAKYGKSCIVIKSLRDINITILEKILHLSIRIIRQKYPE